MSGEEDHASEYQTRVVRLFPDDAESVIWFDGPVDYAATRLDPTLVDDLRAWDESYLAGLDSRHEWRSRGLETAHRQEGARLAQRLADEIGEEFEVEVDTERGARRVRAAGRPRNASAASAFRTLADQARHEWSQLHEVTRRARDEGHDLAWSAERTQGSR